MLKLGSSIVDCLFQKTTLRSRSKCRCRYYNNNIIDQHIIDLDLDLDLCRSRSRSMISRSRSKSTGCLSRGFNFYPEESFVRVRSSSRSIYKRMSVRWISASSRHARKSREDLRTHYEILDVQRAATSDEIRDAFLKLSKKYHPDINKDPDNHTQFVRINEAYSVLNKPLSRRDYDLTLYAERYLKKQHYSSAYRSHGYGYSGESGHYYYHRSYVHEEGFSSKFNQEQDFNSGKRLHHGLVNFFSLTAFLTVAVVAFILQTMYTLYPNVPHKKFIHGRDIDNHDLIMTSEHDGRIVFYYAIPNEKDPQKFEVLAVAKKENDENSEELEKLNSISKSKLVT